MIATERGSILHEMTVEQRRDFDKTEQVLVFPR